VITHVFSCFEANASRVDVIGPNRDA
jgi:hypothetical protein